ncbi:MAG TPA: hypothetical protein VN894_20440 [Polyangiaceae bacterium]|nr:hypothetical protein [Polyangiaceae bacterium]
MSDPADDQCSDPVTDALWKRVLDAWDDDATHAALLDHALRVQALPEIAGRYRALADDPDKGLVAKRKLDGIVVAATQLLMSMKTPNPAKVPLSITLTAFAIFVLMLGWLALAVWHR